MCDKPVPCDCTRRSRASLRAECIARQDALRALWSRLRSAGQLSEKEDELLMWEAEGAWDDAIHIASADDPTRSLCGQYGRNLCDLPERPDGGSGCWTCLARADALATETATQELVPA